MGPKHHQAFIRVLAAASVVTLYVLLLPTMAAAVTSGITGTATNASSGANPPIEHLNVCVSPKGGASTTCQETSGGGKYTLEFTAGEYEVRFTGEVCVSGSGGGFSCTHEYVEKIVTGVQVVSGKLTVVNGPLLEVDGKISGRVTSAGAPVEHVEVCALFFVCAVTNSNGEYTIERVPPGSYRVEFSPLVPVSCKEPGCQRANYIVQFWNNQATFEFANVVTVKESQTTTAINAELQPGGHIAGRVSNASIYAEPISAVHVCARPTRTNKEGARDGSGECAFTNGAGEYTIQTLASGGYEVEFTGEVCVEEKGAVKCTHPYIAQVYQGIVSVRAPSTTSNVNGNLLEVSPTKPVNTGAPTVTAAKTLIATAHPLLSCSKGTWAGKPTSLTYKWLRNGVAISGQTANTYAVQNADAGTGVACEVTASNAAGAAAALSNTVQIPKLSGIAVFHSASLKGSTVSITLRCSGAGACSGVLEILVRVTSGHGKHKKTRSTTIGRASFSIALGKSSTVRVHLTSNGRKLLRQAGSKGVKVQIAGRGVQAHSVLLKAKPKRHH